MKNFAKAWDFWSNFPYRKKDEVDAAMSLWACNNPECPITVYSAMAGVACRECGQTGSFLMPMKRTERLSLRSSSDWKDMLSQAPRTMAFKLALPAVAVLLWVFSTIYLAALMAAVDGGNRSLSVALPLSALSVIGAGCLAFQLAKVAARALVGLGMMFTAKRAVPAADDEPVIQEEAWN